MSQFKPILILVDGASGSGKTTVSTKIAEKLSSDVNYAIICQDRYYCDSSSAHNTADRVEFNYDHPNAFRWDALRTDLMKLLNREAVDLPIYDYVNHCVKTDEADRVENLDVIILEGIYSLYDKEINSWANLKIFVDTPKDECLIRRLERDVNSRGRSLVSVINQWRDTVRPMYNKFIEPLKFTADIIVPWSNHSQLALDAVAHALCGMLKEE
ncbi:uridine kinase [Ureaplasma sp. OM1]|uniref:Uridine kinase n=2 Tax=Ureaplasma ceti TaxID=3119530 RepID=A0ABP9U7C3_9BACT